MKQDNGSAARRNRVPGDIAAVALIVFGMIAAAVTIIAIIESYSNLLAFALDHGLHGWRAAIAPGATDSFIVMGELLLFAGLLLNWTAWQPYALGGGMVVWGFLLSVGGNVWHAPSASAVDRAVAAIWPVTATAGLAGGLIIIKRVMASSLPTSQTSSPGVPGREPARKPRPAAVAARTGPAAAVRSGLPAMTLGELKSEQERDLARALVTSGKPLPGINRLADDAGIGSGKAKRILDAVRAQMNGNGHDPGHDS